jgi:hypothetical protein
VWSVDLQNLTNVWISQVNSSSCPLINQSVDINIAVTATRNIPGVQSVFPIEFGPVRKVKFIMKLPLQMSDDTCLLYDDISWVKPSFNHMQNLRPEELVKIKNNF